MSGVTRRRIARKAHTCGCGRRIPPGDAYLEHVAFPGEWHDGPGPWRHQECAVCACRYGRAYEVAPSYEQCARQGLL